MQLIEQREATLKAEYEEKLIPTNWRELEKYFEANFLDGDKVQKGQMIAAVDVIEFIKEREAAHEEKVREARIDEVNLIPDQLDNPTDYACYDMDHEFNHCSNCYKQKRISSLTQPPKEGTK